LKVLVPTVILTPLSTLRYAHPVFERLFQDALPPGFSRDLVDVFWDGYADAVDKRFDTLDSQIAGQLARLDNMCKEIEENAADLDEEGQETRRDCQQRHLEGCTTHQISVKALRCDFRPKRTAVLTASAAHACCAASASNYKPAKAS